MPIIVEKGRPGPRRFTAVASVVMAAQNGCGNCAIVAVSSAAVRHFMNRLPRFIWPAMPRRYTRTNPATFSLSRPELTLGRSYVSPHIFPQAVCEAAAVPPVPQEHLRYVFCKRRGYHHAPRREPPL